MESKVSVIATFPSIIEQKLNFLSNKCDQWPILSVTVDLFNPLLKRN
jgi:hypothetical protein